MSKRKSYKQGFVKCPRCKTKQIYVVETIDRFFWYTETCVKAACDGCGLGKNWVFIRRKDSRQELLECLYRYIRGDYLEWAAANEGLEFQIKRLTETIKKLK